MGFNGNPEGFAPNMPCKDCKERNAYCHSQCAKYKEWQVAQKHYSNKVRWIRKQQGNGIPFNQTRGNIRGYKK